VDLFPAIDIRHGRVVRLSQGEATRQTIYGDDPVAVAERFADGDQVFVRRRDGTTFTTNCINVAVESGFYDVELEGGGKSKKVEEILADVEGATTGVFRMIDNTMEAPPHGADERDILSVYLALQMTRTPEQRERICFRSGWPSISMGGSSPAASSPPISPNITSGSRRRTTRSVRPSTSRLSRCETDRSSRRSPQCE